MKKDGARERGPLYTWEEVDCGIECVIVNLDVESLKPSGGRSTKEDGTISFLSLLNRYFWVHSEGPEAGT